MSTVLLHSLGEQERDLRRLVHKSARASDLIQKDLARIIRNIRRNVCDNHVPSRLFTTVHRPLLCVCVLACKQRAQLYLRSQEARTSKQRAGERLNLASAAVDAAKERIQAHYKRHSLLPPPPVPPLPRRATAATVAAQEQQQPPPRLHMPSHALVPVPGRRLVMRGWMSKQGT